METNETETPNKAKLIAKAKLIKAMIEGGDRGEKKAAQDRYLNYLKVHNLKDSDVDETANMRVFKVHDPDDAFIISEAISAIAPYQQPKVTAKHITAILDDEDFEAVLGLVKYFTKLWRIEKHLLTISFLTKHREFFTPDASVMKKHSHNKPSANYYENTPTKKQEEPLLKKAEALYNENKVVTVYKDDESFSEEFATINNMARSNEMVPILLKGSYKKKNSKQIGK